MDVVTKLERIQMISGLGDHAMCVMVLAWLGFAKTYLLIDKCS